MNGSLEELRARARSVDAGLEEWDALLLELSRTPGSDEDPRARADVLLLILEDPWLGGFSGSEGVRVDKAAARALLALGEPYASELPERLKEGLVEGLVEGLDKGRDRPERKPAPASRPVDPASAPERSSGRVGRVLGVLAGAVEVYLVLAKAHISDNLKALSILLGLVLVSTLLPALIPKAVRGSPLDSLRRAGMVLLFVSLFGWSVMACTIWAYYSVTNRDLTSAMVTVTMAVVQWVAFISLVRAPYTGPRSTVRED